MMRILDPYSEMRYKTVERFVKLAQEEKYVVETSLILFNILRIVRKNRGLLNYLKMNDKCKEIIKMYRSIKEQRLDELLRQV